MFCLSMIKAVTLKKFICTMTLLIYTHILDGILNLLQLKFYYIRFLIWTLTSELKAVNFSPKSWMWNHKQPNFKCWVYIHSPTLTHLILVVLTMHEQGSLDKGIPVL